MVHSKTDPCSSSIAPWVAQCGEDDAVPAVADQNFVVAGTAEAVARHRSDDGGKLRGLRHRDEARITVEAEEAGRMQLSELPKDGRGGGVVQPTPTDRGGANKGSGEADAEEYFDEEVVVEHLGYGGCRCRWGMPLCVATHTRFLLGFGPGNRHPKIKMQMGRQRSGLIYSDCKCLQSNTQHTAKCSRAYANYKLH